MVWILLEIAENQQTVKLFNEPLKLYNKLYCIWPSIYFLLLIQVRLAGGTLLVIIGKEMGYILGRSDAHPHLWAIWNHQLT